MNVIVNLKNPKRKKQIDEFVDKRHPIASEFYEIMEKDLSTEILQKKLEEFITIDPNYFEIYPVLSGIYMSQNRPQESLLNIFSGFRRAVLKIADKDGNWPKVMEWGWHENRHLMTMIFETADVLWMIDKTEEALTVLRKLLKCNPRDNQGARYAILAILLKLPQGSWDKPFRESIHGMTFWDSKITKWFDTEAKKFPEEFDWLFKEWKKYE